MNDKNKLLDFSKMVVTKEDSSKLKEILDGIEADPKSYDFLLPVDFVGLGLDDYLTIVKNPMDVSTIKNKLKASQYNNVKEVINDIDLIWSNCKLYNSKGSEIWKMANSLEKLSKRLIEKVYKPKVITSTSSKTIKEKTNVPAVIEKEDEKILEDQDNSNILSLREKIELTERVRKLSDDGITSLVRIVQKECPNALDEIDQDKLQVKVDMLDRAVYNKINFMIDNQ